MSSIDGFIKKISQPKCLYTLIAINIFLILALRYVRADIETLDAKFFYLKSAIQPIFASLGEEGRHKYILVNYIDFGLIAAYSLFFVSAYYVFFHEATAKSLLVVPTLLALVDTTETSIIFYLLKTFPESNNSLEYALMFLTPAKWFFALSSLLVIVNGYVLNYYLKNIK